MRLWIHYISNYEYCHSGQQNAKNEIYTDKCLDKYPMIATYKFSNMMYTCTCTGTPVQ